MAPTTLPSTTQVTAIAIPEATDYEPHPLRCLGLLSGHAANDRFAETLRSRHWLRPEHRRRADRRGYAEQRHGATTAGNWAAAVQGSDEDRQRGHPLRCSGAASLNGGLLARMRSPHDPDRAGHASRRYYPTRTRSPGPRTRLWLRTRRTHEPWTPDGKFTGSFSPAGSTERKAAEAGGIFDFGTSEDARKPVRSVAPLVVTG